MKCAKAFNVGSYTIFYVDFLFIMLISLKVKNNGRLMIEPKVIDAFS